MTEAPQVRQALRESIRDIEPDGFRSRLRSALSDRPVTPGVLTVRTALAIDGTVNVEAAAYRGAGVQLSYEGLALTRSIVDEDPWVNGDPEDGDVDVLAAGELVAKGFYHLAHTGVRDRAVEIVRRFGRNHSGADRPRESSLEFDVIGLAIETGADLAGPTVPPGLLEYADDLAADLESDPLPEHEEALAGVDEEIERIVTTADPMAADDRSQSSTLDR